jgi:Ca2+-binding RTX toxin-like protein
MAQEVRSNEFVIADPDVSTYTVTGTNNLIAVGWLGPTINLPGLSPEVPAQMTVSVTAGGPTRTVTLGTKNAPGSIVDVYGIDQATLDQDVSNATVFPRGMSTFISVGTLNLTFIITNPFQFVAIPTLIMNDQHVGFQDTTTNAWAQPVLQPYAGPDRSISSQFVAITPDSINLTASAPSVFLKSGSGMDGLWVTSGNNVLDGGTGSTFFTGGTGNDSFYMDDRNPAAPIWSTIVNFHAGDQAVVLGVNASDFTLQILDDRGAAGFTGVDLQYSRPGQQDVSVTFAGYTSADITSGRLTMAYDQTANGDRLVVTGH